MLLYSDWLRMAFALGYVAAALLLASCQAGPLMPSRLRVEYMDRPLGLDVALPRFSWALEHTDRGEKQTAYLLTVMAWEPSQLRTGVRSVEDSLQWASRESLGMADFVDLLEGASFASMHWSSGWVASNQSTNVPYSGTPALTSDTMYSWSVAYRDAEGAESPVASSVFSTGLLTSSSWSDAEWLDGEQGNQLRYTFDVSPT